MVTKNNYKGWIYLAPSLVLIIIFSLYPLIDTFITSFYKDYNYLTVNLVDLLLIIIWFFFQSLNLQVILQE